MVFVNSPTSAPWREAHEPVPAGPFLLLPFQQSINTKNSVSTSMPTVRAVSLKSFVLELCPCAKTTIAAPNENAVLMIFSITYISI